MYTLGAKQKDSALGTLLKHTLFYRFQLLQWFEEQIIGVLSLFYDHSKEKHTDELCSQLTALIEETTLCFFVVSNTLDGSLIV